ncbi:hypothetical protein J2I47_00885 [Fibrella sp. HMF5335]|uniref:Uncharacterized protein n=1 Tax=Fibrella rubiginis TaxID=2817060 RepID=A0A939GA42_9BACT|nr:hypothetical protein [Fibrella rubiginis]MBO0935089.1 hypothetical protein [Fibrella rubiginis]
METLIIKVTSLHRAKTMAKALAEQSGVMAVSIQPSTTPRRTRARVDPVTLASEASLAQAWNSPEDEVWDAYYQELCTKKAI